MKTPQDLLSGDNYFHWEFNMRMALARKGLLDHILEVKAEAEMTAEWKAKDMKAYAIIAQGIEVEHQSKIRHARTAKEVWETPRDYYNKRNLQNRVALTRRLHEFRMEEGSSMSSHLDRFDELVLSMEAVGDVMDQARQMTILLGSLPQEYDMIVSIIENSINVMMVDVKEKLLKTYDKMQQQETTEGAFRARHHGGRGTRMMKSNQANKWIKKKNGFRGKCHKCNEVGHKARDCTGGGKKGDDVAFSVRETSGQGQGWLLDSGASSHMTPHRDDFHLYKTLKKSTEVTIADGATMRAIGQGTVKFCCRDGTMATVENVLHIPNLDRRLMSVPKMTTRGLDVRFGATQCSIWKGEDLLLSAKRDGNVYTLYVTHEKAMYEHAMYVAHEENQSEWERWHARTGHASREVYEKTQAATEGLPNGDTTHNENLCGGCMKGKMSVASFPKESKTKTTAPLELVHTDVMGPMKTRSTGGSRYVLTFVDDYSGFTKVYFMKAKSEVATKFMEYKAEMEQQCNARIKCLRSDNGGEYKSKRLTLILKKAGIVHQKTVPYSPQQNGVAERMNRTLMEKARSMMHYKCVAKKWWAEAVAVAVYLINMMTNSNHTDTTPVELCLKRKPHLGHLRVFGSLGYAHIDESKRNKLDAKSFRCMFLGYATNTKGCKVLDVEANTVRVSRSVVLDEGEVGGIYEPGEAQPIFTRSMGVTSDKDAIDWTPDGPCDPRTETEDVIMEDSNQDDVEMSLGEEIVAVPTVSTAQRASGSPNDPGSPNPHRSARRQHSIAGPRRQELPWGDAAQSDALVFRPQAMRRPRTYEQT